MQHQQNTTTSRLVMERVIAVAALGMALIVMGSIIVPAESPAGSADHPSHANDQSEPAHAPDADRADAPDHSSSAGEGLQHLGSFEGRDYRIETYATDVGVRYTIIDATTGETLGELLSLEQAKKWYPDASLWETDFSAPGASDHDTIMYTDPDKIAPDMY